MVEKILSVNNELVKSVAKLTQRKYREESGKFLLEGWRCIREAVASGIEIETVFITCHCERSEAIKSKLLDFRIAASPQAAPRNDMAIIHTTEAVLSKISTTDTAPEAVAVGVQKVYDRSVLDSAKKVVLLENIKDPGNLGTILRTCTAFCVDAVVLYGDSVDVYTPKCVRASVGNLWKIPVFSTDDLSVLENFERIATLPRAETTLKNFTAKTPCLIMFGSEADGLSDELINFSTRQVRIEMSREVESLNLAVSCGIVLYNL